MDSKLLFEDIIEEHIVNNFMFNEMIDDIDIEAFYYNNNKTKFYIIISYDNMEVTRSHIKDIVTPLMRDYNIKVDYDKDKIIIH